MKSSFDIKWNDLKRSGFFSLFRQPYPNWKTIIDTTIAIAESCVDNNILLSGLFQCSGITIPLHLMIGSKQGLPQNWLSRIQTGDAIAAHCMTEPGCGSDVFAMQTTAVCEGKFWRVNGVKTYVCNASVAEVGLLYTRLPGTDRKSPSDIGCFLIDMSLPGIEVEPLHQKIGLPNVPMATIRMRDVMIPAAHLIAQNEAGQQMVYMSTTFERLLIPIAFIGKMRQFYAQAKGVNKAELYRQMTICESLLSSLLPQVDLTRWHRRYIQIGCLLKWQLSDSYIESAKLSNNESEYRDALSSWIYSGTNDVLKSALGQLLC